MRFPPQTIDDIRARVPVSQVVGRKVRLKRAGRVWKGLCPFHSEKTPSFVCDDQRQNFHCYGCEEKGDVFGFLMRSERLSFPDAVERLAREAGVSLPAPDPQMVKREARRLTLIDVLEKAQRFFVAGLSQRVARDYLSKRGLDHGTVKDFGIGYAGADGRDLAQHLRQAGVSDDLAIEAGLVVEGRDKFRGRITFPIKDRQGRVVGFGARALGSSLPKYLNSPETPIFKKGDLLFNADRARQPAHDGEPLIVVEGYFDVIAIAGAGFPATVGTMGTALTPAQLLGLWRLSDTPIICFDGDAAGRRAMGKVMATAFPLLLPGRSLRFVALPPGMDPDDMVRNRGAEALGKAVVGAEGLADTFWRLNLEGRSVASPDAQAKFEADLLAQINTIPDAQLRQKYIRDARDRVYRLPKQSTMIVRANGHSLHSTSPGSIRMTKGLQETNGFTLREAAMLAELAQAPAAIDPEALALAKVSERTRQVINEILYLVGSIPEEELRESIRSGKIGSAIDEARTILHSAGVTSLDG